MTAYSPTVWINNVPPPLSAANLNKLTDELELQALAINLSHSLPTWVNGGPPALTDAAPLNEMERVTQAVAQAYGLSYSPTTWSSGWTPARNATRLNKIENQVKANRDAIDGQTITWRGPQTITTGGTYVNNWESTSGVPAISIQTNQPVIISGRVRHLVGGAGYTIDAYNGTPDGADVTIRNLYVQCSDTFDSPRWYIGKNWKNLLIENCTIENSRGIELWPNNQANPTTKIWKNRHTNIKGTSTGAALNLVGNFVQFRVIWGGPSDPPVNSSPGTLEVAWNEITNVYNQSNPEDVISVFKTAKTRIHDNLINGQTKPPALATGGSSQNTITIDPGGEPNLLYNNLVEDNVVVDAYSIGMFGGNNNEFRRNIVVSDGKEGDTGISMPYGYSGMFISASGTGNIADSNQIAYYGASGRVDTQEDGGTWTNTTHIADPITRQTELDYVTLWRNRVSAAGYTIGANVATPPSGNYLLNEDFNGTTLDSKWKKRWWWGGDSFGTGSVEQQAYRESQTFLDGNGNLVLRALRQNVTDTTGVARTWISGMVQTNGFHGAQFAGYSDEAPGFTFTYGLIESRIKVPKGVGIFPAFWLCDSDYTAGCSREIDILEVVGWAPRVAQYNVHLSGINQGSSYTYSADLGDAFHVYGLEWRPTYIAYFFDGVERWRYTGGNIPSNPHYIIFNFALGGSWPGPTDGTTPSPQDMLIDYVRVSP